MAFIQGCKKAYQGLITAGNGFKHILLLAMRLYWGFSFFQAGWGKLQNITAVSGYFNSLHIPMPLLNAYVASSIECFGGLLLLIGFASRLVSIPLAVVMIVALSTASVGATKMIWEDPANFIAQLPFTYLLTCLFVFSVGPGMFSVDGILKGLFFKSSRD